MDWTARAAGTTPLPRKVAFSRVFDALGRGKNNELRRVFGAQRTAAAGHQASALVALLSIGICSSPALADFYQGKTLTVIVGYAPGGGVDASARTMTRHFGRFIPGRPTIVVQNMEGAAGIVSVNHLDRRVAPDALTLAVPGRSWYIEAIVQRPGISSDPTRF